MQTAQLSLARRYAQALFLCACERGEAAAVEADLQACGRALGEAHDYLRDPRVSVAQKKEFVRAAVESQASPLTLDFLELLIDKKRFELLGLVAGCYVKLARSGRGAVLARVSTARALSEDDGQRLGTRLEAFAGCPVEMEYVQDPSLLGGSLVRLGDWVMDNSFSGQLRRIKEALCGD